MSLFDPKKYCESLWDWDFLRPCFYVEGRSHGIGVADLDGVVGDEGSIVQKHGYVERFRHHLLFETTVPLEREIWKGQVISHAALVKIGFSVIYLWGKPNNFPLHKMQVWREFNDHPNDPVLDVTEARLVALVTKWFEHACQNPITPPPKNLFFRSES
jgi:hypothetical protein